MKYVLLYDSAPDADARIAEHVTGHRALWTEFLEQGTLVMIGPFTDRSGALAVFTTRSAAEAFAASDPFVTNGVVANWYVREWMEALVPED